jgi:serine/threonine protein kinase
MAPPPCLPADAALLGEGALASVYYVSGAAVKVQRKDVLVFLKTAEAALREKATLEAYANAAAGDSRSPFITNLRGVAQDEDHLFLYQDAVLASSGGVVRSITLRHMLSHSRPAPLPMPAIGCLAACLASALSHLHQRGIAHRDVKPDNICIAADGMPCLVDFGCATFCAGTSGGSDHGRSTSLVGTLPYIAPEVLSRRGHGCACDWWSLGILISESLTHSPPFGGGIDEMSHVALASAQRAWLDLRGSAKEEADGVPALPDSILLDACKERITVSSPNPGAESERSWDLHCLLGALLLEAEDRRVTGALEWARDHAPPPDMRHVPVRTQEAPEGVAGDGMGLESSAPPLETFSASRGALRCLLDAMRGAADEGGGTARARAEQLGQGDDAEDEGEAVAAAWAAEERQELLDRAAISWKKTAAEWRTRFDEYGPWL